MGSAYAGPLNLKEFGYKVMKDLPNYTNNTFIFTNISGREVSERSNLKSKDDCIDGHFLLQLS